MSNPYCSQKRRRTHQTFAEQGDSATEHSRKKAKQTKDMSPSDRVSTSTSRPPGKKLLFGIPHSGHNTEELNQPTANFARQTHHGTTSTTSPSISAVQVLSSRAPDSTATSQARRSSTFPSQDAPPSGPIGLRMPPVGNGGSARSSSNTIVNGRPGIGAYGKEISAPTNTSQHLSSTAVAHLVSVPLGQLEVQHGVYSSSLRASQSMAQDSGLFLVPTQASVNALQGSGSLPEDRPRAFRDQWKKIKLTGDTGGLKPDAELQLKDREVKRMRTEVAERNAIIAKLQAALVKQETTLREVQALVSGCHRLLGALEAGLTTCQNMVNRMQTKAKDSAYEGEELHTHDTGQKLDRLDGDTLSIHEANSAVQRSYLSGHADNGALCEEARFFDQDLDSWARRWST